MALADLGSTPLSRYSDVLIPQVQQNESRYVRIIGRKADGDFFVIVTISMRFPLAECLFQVLTSSWGARAQIECKESYRLDLFFACLVAAARQGRNAPVAVRTRGLYLPLDHLTVAYRDEGRASSAAGRVPSSSSPFLLLPPFGAKRSAHRQNVDESDVACET